MPRYQSKNANSNFTPVPAGAHVAWLIHFIDLGTHMERSQQYGDKEKRRARIVFALPNEIMNDGRPMTIGKSIVLSGHEKSNFRKMCTSWLARSFTDKSFSEWDERELFQVPCTITVVQNEGEDGRPFAYVDGVQPLMRGMVAPELTTDDFIYLSLDPERFDQAEYDKLGSLSEKLANDLRSKIESSPEWADLICGDQQAQQEDSGEWHTQDPADDQYQEPEPAPPPPPRQQPAPQQRPTASSQRPGAPQQAQRQPAPPQQQRPAAHSPAQRPSGPAPARPPVQQGSVSQRASTPGPRSAPQQAPRQQPQPQQRRPAVDPDVDEIPF